MNLRDTGVGAILNDYVIHGITAMRCKDNAYMVATLKTRLEALIDQAVTQARLGWVGGSAPTAPKTDEYNLKEAGNFSVADLLDFELSELNKGNKVRKVWITKRQAAHLVNEVEGKKPPATTGKKLVDYWNAPKTLVNLESLHGIEIGVDYE